MARRPQSIDATPADLMATADLISLRANLALSPAQRIVELVAMNRFHAEVQVRTLAPWLRAALQDREVEEARRRLREAGA